MRLNSAAQCIYQQLQPPHQLRLGSQDILQDQRAGQSSVISYDFRPYYGCFGGETMGRVHAIFEELR